MGKPKKRTSSRRTGSRRSHLALKLARRVNATSPVKVYTIRRSTLSSRSKGRESAKRPKDAVASKK